MEKLIRANGVCPHPHGFLKVDIPFTSFIDGTRPDERRSVHHRGLFTPPLELPSPLLA
jgi:hypothetical protein